jgi:hypothetical protein
MQTVNPESKSERAAPAPLVVGSGERSESLCPICETPLRGPQRSACSPKCRAAKSRRRRAEERTEKDRRVREPLEATLRVVSGTGEG